MKFSYGPMKYLQDAYPMFAEAIQGKEIGLSEVECHPLFPVIMEVMATFMEDQPARVAQLRRLLQGAETDMQRLRELLVQEEDKGDDSTMMGFQVREFMLPKERELLSRLGQASQEAGLEVGMVVHEPLPAPDHTVGMDS